MLKKVGNLTRLQGVKAMRIGVWNWNTALVPSNAPLDWKSVVLVSTPMSRARAVSPDP